MYKTPIQVDQRLQHKFRHTNPDRSESVEHLNSLEYIGTGHNFMYIYHTGTKIDN